MTQKKAKLVFKDGSVFEGWLFGAQNSASGEAVFNTGMVGYPEALTDPSYFGQILILTYPLIGNYGVPSPIIENGVLNNFESVKIQPKALIVSDYSFQYSHWQAKKSLDEWLKEEGVPGLYGIDTRALTKKLREKGAMLAKVVVENESIGFYDPNKENLMPHVSCSAPHTFQTSIAAGYPEPDTGSHLAEGGSARSAFEKGVGQRRLKIGFLDCGAKESILRSLLARDVSVVRLPYDTDISKYSLDALVVSNGPGDPKFCKKPIESIKKAMKKEMPVFGICLGHQLLALAAGADTYKLKYGHRSQNQPCQDTETKKCYITSQNHGFAVSDKLPKEWKVWFRNINDGTVEGIKHREKPFWGVQFHPEANPGPTDTRFLFNDFIELCKKYKKCHGL